LRDALADRYPVERPLGRGGMATVYLARDLKHQRSVAIKVLHPELAAGIGTERFLREIRIEAGLQHPHILPLHDSGEADGFLYYVMPYVSGQSLRERLAREGPLPIEDALRIAGEVGDALGHAHERGVVHRDIKPENILLSGGHALVADFGIAKAIEVSGDARLTETGWGMGTPAYMSPEQIVGEPVDGRSDVYSLGCVVYEMLAGRPPFEAATARAVFTRHQIDPPPSIRGTRPEVAPHIEEAVLTALAKLPDERFPTAGRFLEALRGTGAGGPRPRITEVPAAGSPHPSRVLVGLAAAGVLAVGGYLVAVRGDLGLRAAARAISVAVLPLEDLDGDTSTAYVAEGMTDELITNLARISALQVINRRSMSAYRGSGKTPREVARELDVDAVVTGTMQWRGDTVHLTTQVSLAGEDGSRWAQSYDGNRGDLLRLQREIARAVAERIRGELTPADRAGLEPTPAVAPEALDSYIRARHWLNRRGRANLLRAVDLFNQALDQDPGLAQAYSGVATSYVQLGYASLLPPADAFPKAGAAARRALELDSTLAEPHAVLGFVHLYYDWNWAAADSQFRVAIERNPGDATAHEWYGLYLAAMGRFEEAQRETRRAVELDPLSVAAAATAGWVLHYSGDQREAERQLRIALRMDPTFDIARLYLGRVLQFDGLLDSAVAQFDSLGVMRQWIPNVAGLGYVYGQQGRAADARAVLDRMDSLARREYVTPYAVALVHTALGDRDSAFAWLNRAVEERAHWLVWLNRDRRWAPLRFDPRFAELVRRVDLPT
jgi:serine/threonine-protein kinase